MSGSDITERVAALRDLGASTLGGSGADRLIAAPPPVWPGATTAGRALPVRCSPGDNLALHVAVATASPGDVLVVTVGELAAFGYWGEVLTVAAISNGIAGLVIDGCVRDVAALEQRRFPVFARGVALPSASKTQAGSIGRPVEFAGARVAAGNWVVADRDGVVVFADERYNEVVDAAHQRAAREQRMFTAIEEGATTLELLGLDETPIERA